MPTKDIHRCGREQKPVFWPGIPGDIATRGASCGTCKEIGRSQPKLPQYTEEDPEYPSQDICGDYFQLGGVHYLVTCDRLMGWPDRHSSPRGTSGVTGLISNLRDPFATLGIPEILRLERGPEIRASEAQKFLKIYNVYSWENMAKDKAYMAEEKESDEEQIDRKRKNNEEWEESFFTSNYKTNLQEVQTDVKVEDVILYTGNNKNKITGLDSKTHRCALLDCRCTMNVCGEDWWRCYRAGLSEQDKEKIKEKDSWGKRFCFGEGEVLPSIK